MSSTPEYLEQIYKAYRDWKRSYRVVRPAAERELYAREFARISAPKQGRVLEVGFGEGLFLDWARDQGFAVEGVEISPDYVEAARSRGHQVWQGTVQDLSSDPQPEYDVVVCLDVLEHMTVDQIIDFFHAVKPVLREDGLILARFPNGASPFGRVYQHGDATHVTALTGLKMDQLAFLAGLKVSKTLNAARVFTNARLLGIPARLRYPLAVIVEWFLGQIFFNARLPMDPNIVVHIRHRNGSV